MKIKELLTVLPSRSKICIYKKGRVLSKHYFEGYVYDTPWCFCEDTVYSVFSGNYVTYIGIE